MTSTLTLPTTEPAPAVAVPTAERRLADRGCFVAVSPSGRLRLPPAADVSAISMHRRTGTGTVYRINLGDDISCWLDGDQHDGSGEANPIATAMCTALSSGAFLGPDDAPFVCALVLFTGTRHVHRTGTGPVALTDGQLRRIVDAHATASDDLDAPAWIDLVTEVAQPQPVLT
jgi:hypothetical protein